jgi:hypothetical protein
VESCIVLNTEDNKPNIVVTFVTDVILLVIMLVGLLILRRESGVTCPLGELLWNQVRLGHSTSAEVLLNPLTFSSGYHLARNCHRSGGAAIGKLVLFLHILVTHLHAIVTGIYRFESERYCLLSIYTEERY